VVAFLSQSAICFPDTILTGCPRRQAMDSLQQRNATIDRRG
jgi:hypothetical protein